MSLHFVDPIYINFMYLHVEHEMIGQRTSCFSILCVRSLSFSCKHQMQYALAIDVCMGEFTK